MRRSEGRWHKLDFDDQQHHNNSKDVFLNMDFKYKLTNTNYNIFFLTLTSSFVLLGSRSFEILVKPVKSKAKSHLCRI